nr:MAG: RNA-dependent RNA polymerase [Jingmen rodent lispivirus 1]
MDIPNMDEILLEGIEERRPFDPDLHLQTALRIDQRLLLYELLKNHDEPSPIQIRRQAEVLRLQGLTQENSNIENEHLYGTLFSCDSLVLPDKIRLEDTQASKEDNTSLTKKLILITDTSRRVACRMANLGLHCVNAFFKTPQSLSCSEIEGYKPSRLVQASDILRLIWYQIRTVMYIKQKRNDLQVSILSYSSIGYVDMYVSSTYAIFIKESVYQVLDYHQVLMIHDTVTSRYLSRLTCSISEFLSSPLLPTPELLENIYAWGDKLLSEYGNEAYSIIKQFEPICTAVQLDKYDVLTISHSYYQDLLKKGKEDKSDHHLSDCYEMIKDNIVNSNQLFELFGCYRHFGHPTVDEEEGCIKMKEQTRKQVKIDSEVVTQVTGAWTRGIVLQFIKKHKRWPICKTSLGPESTVYKLMTQGVTHFDEYKMPISLEEWASIEFGKEFEFDYYPDLVELLSDKSISPYLLHWARVYCQDMVNVRYEGRMKESRRVLLELLQRPNISVKFICDRVQSKNVPDSWKVVGLHAKEREMKISARLFAMLTLEMRLYFCSTESNIARTIFKYMPNQTMTWSETKLMKHLHKLASRSNNYDHVFVTISLDFEKWNNRWRGDAVNPIFKKMDDLLGVPGLISYTHEFFDSSFYYLSSFLNPPPHIRKYRHKLISKFNTLMNTPLVKQKKATAPSNRSKRTGKAPINLQNSHTRSEDGPIDTIPDVQPANKDSKSPEQNFDDIPTLEYSEDSSDSNTQEDFRDTCINKVGLPSQSDDTSDKEVLNIPGENQGGENKQNKHKIRGKKKEEEKQKLNSIKFRISRGKRIKSISMRLETKRRSARLFGRGTMRGIKIKLAFLETLMTWYRQLGGIEGQRQKGWTAVTDASLQLAELVLGVVGSITGQADNQVIVAAFPIRKPGLSSEDYIRENREELEAEIKRYMDFLNSISQSLGMNIKLEESWVSQHLYNYGKEILVDGIFTGSVLKKISRMFLSVSENYPSINDRIASIHTAAHAACLKGFSPTIPFYIAIQEICTMIQLERMWPITVGDKIGKRLRNKNIILDDKLLLFLNLFPKDYGGYPIMCFLDYLYRGHPDPITSHLTFLKLVQDEEMIAKQIIKWIISCANISEKIDYKMIIQDPVSLNFKRPTNGANVMKNTLESTLKSVTKNTSIKKLMIGASKKDHDIVLNYLSSIRPFSPRVLNTIYRNSPEGARLDFLSTFVDMRTIKNVVSASESRTLLSKLEDCDINWFMFICETYQEIVHFKYRKSYDNRCRDLGIKPSDGPYICTTKLANYLRNKSWDIDIEHVTVPHPFEQTCLVLGDIAQDKISSIKARGIDNPSSHPEHIVYIYIPPTTTLDTSSICLSHGEFPTYYGSKTQPKMSSRLMSFPKTDRSLKAAQSLFKTKTWVCDSDSNLSKFLSSLIKTRTPLTEDLLSTATGTFCGGSVAHRFDDVVTKHDSKPNMRINVLSNIYFSSDNMGKYSKGLENFTMHFQGLFLSALSSINLFLISLNGIPPERLVFKQHVICSECCQIIEDIKLDSAIPPPDILVQEDCPMLYSSIAESSGRLIWKDLNYIKFETPDTTDSMFVTKQACAAALMIMGSNIESDQPLIHTPFSKIQEVSEMSNLSLGSCINIGIGEILYRYTQFWMIDNMMELMSISEENRKSLDMVIRTNFIKGNMMSWGPIKELILHPDLRDQFLDLLVEPPSSSQAFRGTKALDQCMIELCCQISKYILEIGDYGVPMFCVAEGLSINRCIILWIKSLALIGYYDDYPKLSKVSKILLSIYHKLVNNEEIELEAFILSYYDVRSRFSDLPDITSVGRFKLSQFGAEPWLKAKVKPIIPQLTNRQCFSNLKKRSVTGGFKMVSVRYLKASNLCDVRKIIFSNPLIKEMKYKSTYLRMCTVPIRKDIDENQIERFRVTESSRYIEHIAKTKGLYSSAHYKWSSILGHLGLQEINTCLCFGEGDGGVSRMLVMLYNPGLLFFNTKLDISSFPPHRAINYFPPELLSIPNDGFYTTEVKGVDLCINYGGDVTDKNYMRHLRDLIADTEVDLVTCDIESNRAFTIREYIKIIRGMLDVIMYLKGSPIFVLKCYFNSLYEIDTYISELLLVGTEVSFLSPVISSTSAQECFLVVKKFKSIMIKQAPGMRVDMNSHVVEDLILFRSNLHDLDVSAFWLSQSNLDDINSLNKVLDYLGYQSMIPMSLKQLTGGYLDYTSFVEEPLKTLAETYESLHDLTIQRIYSYGLLISGQRIPKALLNQRLNINSEKNDLFIHASFMFNINLLLMLLRHGEIENSVFDYGISIVSNESIVFSTSVDYHWWSRKYGRHWYKVYGWYLVEILPQKPVSNSNL